MVKKISGFIGRTSIGRQAILDGRFRTVLFACGSLCINLAYALVNGIFGIVSSSFWFITLFAYYAILAVMRFYAVTYEFKRTGKRAECSVMRFCGWWICFLAVVLSGMVCLNIATGRDASRHMIPMIAIAAYTFWKATVAIINLIKVRKKNSPLLTTLRNINCVDATVSMLALEHAMLSTFGGGTNSFTVIMDAATGAGAFLIVLILGVSMVAGKKQNESMDAH